MTLPFKPAIFLLLAAIGVFGLVGDPYVLFVLNRAVLYIVLCVGLNVLMGYAGQLAFAHAAMFGIGAYACGLLQVRLGWSFVPAAMAAVAFTTVIGSALTLPALRLSGLYLALSTLAFAMAVQWVFMNWTEVTFGAGGFRVPTLEVDIGIGREQTYFLICLVVAGVVIAATDNILRSKYGRRFVAIRESEIAAGSFGVNVTQTKLFAFAYSSMCAGLAGAFYAPLLRFVAPENFDLHQMILMQVMIVVGGLGSMAGSLIGVCVIFFAFEMLRDTRGLLELFLGVMLIGFVLLQPQGLVEILNRFTRIREPFLPRTLAARERERAKRVQEARHAAS